MDIHDSHSPLFDNVVVECRNCWACSCHAPDMLALVCDRSVEIAASMPEVVKAVERQAARYGEQIRNLEQFGRELDILRVTQAWKWFMRQLNNPYLARMSSTAYYAARYSVE